MKSEIQNGSLVITIPMQAPQLSASGKTLVVASTHGNQKTGCMVNGQEVIIGLNAYIYANVRPSRGSRSTCGSQSALHNDFV